MAATNPPMRPCNTLQALSTRLAGATVTAGGVWEAAACGVWWAGTISGMLGIIIASADDVWEAEACGVWWAGPLPVMLGSSSTLSCGGTSDGGRV